MSRESYHDFVARKIREDKEKHKLRLEHYRLQNELKKVKDRLKELKEDES